MLHPFTHKLSALAVLLCFFTTPSHAESDMPNNYTLALSSDFVVELALGAVKEGKHAQLTEDYFPNVMPVVSEYGGSALLNFRVSGADTSLPTPQMGVLFKWPSVDTFTEFHKDARFTKLRPVRDTAMSMISNAHFYAGENINFEMQLDTPYMLKVWKPNIQAQSSGLMLEAITDSHAEQQFGTFTLEPAPENIDLSALPSHEQYDLYIVIF